MALWKETPKEPATTNKDPLPHEPERPAPPASFDAARQARERPVEVKGEHKEAIISAGLTIEGKIEGSGSVRIAGNFKGDVHVQGNLTIEAGARLTGGVRANTVVIGGELEGNIESAARVELLQSGVLNGDLKAGSLTVAAGSRMRGRAEFGWDEKSGKSLSSV